MSEIRKLYNEIELLKRELRDLKMKVDQGREFQDIFSGKTVINHKVQFMQQVLDKNGGVVTEINP